MGCPRNPGGATVTATDTVVDSSTVDVTGRPVIGGRPSAARRASKYARRAARRSADGKDEDDMLTADEQANLQYKAYGHNNC